MCQMYQKRLNGFCTIFLLGEGGGGGGVESPTKFSKKVVFPNFLTGSEFLEGGCWKRGVTFFSRVEGLQFLHKK